MSASAKHVSELGHSNESDVAPIVFFDLWATLIDEKPNSPFYSAIADQVNVDLRRFMEAYRACGEDFMIGEIPNLSTRVNLVCQQLQVDTSSFSVETMVDKFAPLFLDNVFLYPDTLHVLSELKANGCKIGIISNASSWSETVLDAVGIRSYFDSIVLSYKHKIVKPMPDIYLKALKELNGCAEDCFFVGDGGDNEMVGAKQVGLMTILVDHRHRDDVHADFKVDTLSDAMHIIHDIRHGETRRL